MAGDSGIMLMEIVCRPVIEPQRLAVVIGDFGFAKPFCKFRGANLRIFLSLDEIRWHILSPTSYSGLRFGGGYPLPGYELVIPRHRPGLVRS